MLKAVCVWSSVTLILHLYVLDVAITSLRLCLPVCTVHTTNQQMKNKKHCLFWCPVSTGVDDFVSHMLSLQMRLRLCRQGS